MRVLRDHRSHFMGTAQINYDPPTHQRTSLTSSVGNFWDEWQIQCLILVSFGLQVFLFMAAGMRTRCVSRILGLLLLLAYLLADSVAILVLGHLALHVNGPQHQLLFFWAPFVLFHLGGQDTLTALSMQDNNLWTRHLLGLVTQVAAAGYVISRISWPDRRLLAAMVLMFLSGCYKYAERTICLYKASPTRLMESSLLSLRIHASIVRVEANFTTGQNFVERLSEMLKANVRPPSYLYTSTDISLISDTPTNGVHGKPENVQSIVQGLKSNEDPCRVYNYVGIKPFLLYERLYTKAPLRFCALREIEINTHNITTFNFNTWICPSYLLIPSCLIFTPFELLIPPLLLLFPILSTSTSLVLFFKVVEKGQLYSRADVIVSYILLIGAICLEMASLCVSILSYVGFRDIFRSGRKQWSEMLGQYNMTKCLTTHDTTCIWSFLPYRIAKHLDDNTSRIPISEDLKKFVLDKLCDFGMKKEDWNFASYHGKLALGKWKDESKGLIPTRLETPLNSSINDLDFPTSVLILHIATDILYFLEKKSINSEQQTMKKLSRELSNYIMYLVFKCGVMLTSKTKLLHDKAHWDMKNILNEHINLGEKECITKVFAARKGPRSLGEQVAEMHLLKETFTALNSSLLSRASDVAQELIGIHREAECWDLVAALWLEKLYYIAPRCGFAFHSHHLTTGGEFITHVLFVMQNLGPFIPPQSA